MANSQNAIPAAAAASSSSSSRLRLPASQGKSLSSVLGKRTRSALAPIDPNVPRNGSAPASSLRRTNPLPAPPKPQDSDYIDCICGDKSGGILVRCGQCGRRQHYRCVADQCPENEDDYLCTYCAAPSRPPPLERRPTKLRRVSPRPTELKSDTDSKLCDAPPDFDDDTEDGGVPLPIEDAEDGSSVDLADAQDLASDSECEDLESEVEAEEFDELADAQDSGSDFEYEDVEPEVSAEDFDGDVYDDPATALPSIDNEEEQQEEDDDAADASAQKAKSKQKSKQLIPSEQAARELREHLKYRNLLGVTKEEKNRRIEVCNKRVRAVLECYHQGAKNIKIDAFRADAVDQPAMTFAWWDFLGQMRKDTEAVADIIIAALPDDAKVALGGELTEEDLLKLPSDWHGCKIWGCYLDVLQAPNETETYCGSGTSVSGIRSRLNTYEGLKYRSNKVSSADLGRHTRYLIRPDVNMNLRLLAFFDPHKTPKPYIMLAEKILSVVVQTFNQQSDNRYFPASAINLYREAVLTVDLPSVKWTGLNEASQIRQGLFSPKQTKPHTCIQCGRVQVSTDSRLTFLNARAGVRFLDKICYNCRNRQGRDHKNEAERVARKNIWKTKPEKCPRCGRKIADMKKAENGKDRPLGWSKIRQRIECRDCCRKESAVVPEKAAAKAAATRPENCPRCHKKIRIYSWSKIRGRWECNGCCAAKSAIPNTQKNRVPKPEICPRCHKKVRDGEKRQHSWSKIRERWECQSCFGSKSAIPKDQLEPKSKQEPKPEICPRCHKKVRDKGIGRYAWSKIRKRWECYICFKAKSAIPKDQLEPKNPKSRKR